MDSFLHDINYLKVDPLGVYSNGQQENKERNEQFNIEQDEGKTKIQWLGDVNKIIDQSDASVATLAKEGNGTKEKPLNVKTGSKRCLTRNKVFKSKRSAQAVKIMFMARYLCNYCDLYLYSKKNIKAHKDKLHKVKQPKNPSALVKNNSCHIRGKTYKNLDNHPRLVHNSKIHICHHCPYTTRFNTNLAKHITSAHTTDNITTCPYCSKSTKNIKRYLQLNLCDKLEKRIVSSVKCILYDKTFSRKEHMEQHLKSGHLQILDVLCLLCDYKTHCNFNLKVHMTGAHKDPRGPYKVKTRQAVI